MGVMRELQFRKGMLAVPGGVFALASIFASQAIAAESGSPNTLAYYDPSLVKATGAFQCRDW
jgi:hypothetical protein